MAAAYHPRLKGFPHPTGIYSGYVDDDGWYLITGADGHDFETQDRPEEVIVLCGVVHVEQRVRDLSGAIILAVAEWPKYMQQQAAEGV